MKTVRNLVLTICLFICSGLSAQKFSHSIGLSGFTSAVSGYAVAADATKYTQSHYDLTLQEIGITYYPKIRIVQCKNISFNIGLPVTAGIGTTSKYSSQDYVSFAAIPGTPGMYVISSVSGTHFAFNIPVVADLNFGYGAAKQPTKKFGWYIGAGYGYNNTQLSTSTGTVNYHDFNMMLRLGSRFKIASGQSFSAGLSMQPGSHSGTGNTYGVHILKGL